MRTALLADKLLERDHIIYWWASAFEHQRKRWLSAKDTDFHVSPNLTIRALRGCGYRSNISLARYIDHRIVASKFRMQSKKVSKPDIIVASMPCYHLAYEGMRYAHQNKVPLLVDIRDFWPDILLDSLRRFGLHRLGRIALARDFTKLSILLCKADGLLGISEGSLEWALQKAGRSHGKWDKVFYHGYKKILSPPANHSDGQFGEFKDKKIFLFVGTFGNSYELRLILEVAKRLYRNGKKDILFCLAGTGDQFESIKREAANLSNVALPGWLDASEIRKLLLGSWAGIVPCRSVKNAAPNKVFEYLSAALPLISSLEGEVMELIQRKRIGLNYLPGDAQGLYECIGTLISNPSLRNEMSVNASQFFKEYGDADKVYTEYAEHIELLVKAHQRKSKVYHD